MIAKMANTSAATVSRYLSGAGSVNPKTAKRIDEAVLETGYTVKSGRERISTELSKMVMVISSDLSSQVFIDYYLGINDYLRSKDYHCVESYSNFDVDSIITHLDPPVFPASSHVLLAAFYASGDSCARL